MPKGKGKKGKKNKKEAKVSYYQAITSYKITVKEKEIDDCNDELNKLAEVNQNLKQRNRRLQETRQYNMDRAIDEYKKFNKQFNARDVCSRDQVINELKDVWRFKLGEEKAVIGLKRELKKLERDINDEKQELKIWTDFRDYGQHELRTEIGLLKKELEEMRENYVIMSTSIQNTISSTIEHIKTSTEEAIQKKNKSAAQKAFDHMDKSVIEMSHENKWMTKQIEMLKGEIIELEENASSLEKENINLMGHLFDCNNEEFRCIKSLFDFQFLDHDNLDENSIMDVDLNELSSIRPKSALGLTMRKLKEIEYRQVPSLLERLQIELAAESNQLEPYNENQATSFDEITPSPRFLCLYGTKKKLITSQTQEQTETLKADPSYTKTYWPITQTMLKDVLDT